MVYSEHIVFHPQHIQNAFNSVLEIICSCLICKITKLVFIIISLISLNVAYIYFKFPYYQTKQSHRILNV